jgi:hypothetical protein
MAILAAVVVLLLSGTVLAEAPPSGWYRGLIGRTATALDTPERYEKNKEVEMELRVDRGGRVAGRYFYFGDYGSRGADIAIEGQVARDGTVQLEEKVDGKVTGRWRGRHDEAGLAGTWTDPTGKRKLRFFLERLPDDEAEEHQVNPQVAYRGRRVIGTNLQLPFLTRHPRPEVMKKVNDSIEAGFQGHRCDPSAEFFTWPDDFHVSWKVGYASTDLFSVEVSEEWGCTAPYPSTEPRSFTYDLRTGKEVAFADLFQDYEKNRDPILGTLFAGGVVYPSEDCKDMVATWMNPGEQPVAQPPNGLKFVSGKFHYHLTPTALHVYEVDLVHVIAGCAARAEVPYEKLRRFVAPGGPIALILGSGKPAR